MWNIPIQMDNPNKMPKSTSILSANAEGGVVQEGLQSTLWSSFELDKNTQQNFAGKYAAAHCEDGVWLWVLSRVVLRSYLPVQQQHDQWKESNVHAEETALRGPECNSAASYVAIRGLQQTSHLHLVGLCTRMLLLAFRSNKLAIALTTTTGRSGM